MNTLCKELKVNKKHLAQIREKIFTLKKYSEKTGYSNQVTGIQPFPALKRLNYVKNS